MEANLNINPNDDDDLKSLRDAQTKSFQSL